MTRWLSVSALLTWLLTAVAAADAPATSDPEADGSDRSEESTTRPGGLGLTPGTLQTGNMLIGPNRPTAAVPSGDENYGFKFSGFLRAPMRLGFGQGGGPAFAEDVSGGTKIHSPPQVPDNVYTDWRFTNNMAGPWAELHFAYGNERASAHVIIGAYNFTDSGYRDLQAQLGINQAFVTLDFPRAFRRWGGIIWNVGGFANAYGAAGRYDAGRYDTYLIGRTHVAGETLTAYFDLHPDIRLTIEHGIGAKLQATPFAFVSDPQPPYLPYPGPLKQGTTILHHAHVGATYRDKATLGAHYLTTWTDDAQGPGERDGRITVLGLDLKLTGGLYGDGYLGYSHVESRDIMRLAQSLEYMHSFSGWSLRDNFFPGSPTGTGTIDTVLFQYTYSLATLLRHPEPFWGQGPDIVIGAFGSLSWVQNDEIVMNRPLSVPRMKSKFGGDVTYTMLEWFGASLRYDLVQPDLDDNTRSFSVLSPKLIVRTQFVTHEQVVLSYAKYFYGENVTASWPNESRPPDEHAVNVVASMWW